MDYRIEQLRYLLREDPSSRIFFQLGELLRREGEPAEAVEVLESGLERHPRYVAAWVALGRAYRDLAALAEAVNAFETALAIDRENPVAARLLGDTAVEREDWLGAVKALKLTRALAGGDDELDAQIARVEARLDDDGRLERAAVRSPQRAPRARSLEVVSFSGDDPFAATSDEPDAAELTSDVFDLAEVAPVVEEEEARQDEGAPSEPSHGVAEADQEPPAVDDDTRDHPAALETPATDAGAGPAAAEDDEAAVDEVVEAADVASEPTHVVDEGSVGAWSSGMAAAGVPGEEAWIEPTGELRLGDHDFAIADPWSEPATGIETAKTTAEEPAAELPPVEGAAVSDKAAADEPAEAPDAAAAEDAPMVEVETFESIEATHPAVIDRRREESATASAPETADEPAEVPDEEPATAAADEVLPGEDRGSDAIEVTRPIAVEPSTAEIRPPGAMSEDADLEPEEAADDDSGDAAAAGGARHELEHGVPLPTMTLARLAFEQNDRPLAMATLENLLDRDPTNAEATAMLDELRAHDETVARQKRRAAHATTKIAALQGWLDAVRLAAERRVQ